MLNPGQKAVKNKTKPGQAPRRADEESSRKTRAAASSVAETLFGVPTMESLGHLSARYPFAARLSEGHLRRFQAANKGKLYRKGTILFEEGARPEGVYVVLEGRVKLSVNSPQGKAMVLGFFGAGTILGLAASTLGRPHVTTAETIQATEAVFVPRSELVAELRSKPLAAWQAAQLLSEDCYFLLTKMATVELSESAQQKMARCLLGLINQTIEHGGAHVELNLSQETIAQMVGLSRETVSRLLSRLRRKGVLDWTRSDFIIRDRAALEKLADLPEMTTGSGEAGRMANHDPA
jgi:CRP-like cAMP-binding protein